MTQTVKGKTTPDTKGRPGQRQQERTIRATRRKRRQRIVIGSIASLIIIVAAVAAVLQYQKYTADQADAAQRARDQHATATVSVQGTAKAKAANATATVYALTPTPSAGPATPPPTTASPVKLSDGVQYIDIREGYGDTVQSGQQASVEYTGWIEGGKKFDSSYDHGGQPFAVTLGAGKTIPGFEEGIAGMKVGGIRRIIIPSAQGYGATGQPQAGIPPNATLIFDVTLVSAQ